MNKIESCSFYVAFLRTLYLLSQNSHWVAQGNDFYGNHLLFERIYKSAQENSDQAAERFVGLFGVETLDAKLQSKYIGDIYSKYSTGLEELLKAEKDFLAFAEKFYVEMKKQKDFSLGLDDLLMKISDDNEESVYLLGQAIGNKKKDAATRKNFFKELLKNG